MPDVRVWATKAPLGLRSRGRVGDIERPLLPFERAPCCPRCMQLRWLELPHLPQVQGTLRVKKLRQSEHEVRILNDLDVTES